MMKKASTKKTAKKACSKRDVVEVRRAFIDYLDTFDEHGQDAWDIIHDLCDNAPSPGVLPDALTANLLRTDPQVKRAFARLATRAVRTFTAELSASAKTTRIARNTLGSV